MNGGMLGIALLAVCAGPYTDTNGVIEGVVVNGSENRTPAAGVDVVLRVRLEGQFVSVVRTRTRANGRFRFTGLPTGAGEWYLPGANYDGVHFPGPRVQLSSERPQAPVTIPIFASIRDPCPLVIEDFDAVLAVEPGVVRVTEKLTIFNPTSRCYVGVPGPRGGGPVTLALSVPAGFQRITFDREAFGRRFAVSEEKLVTGIPWPPGRRVLRYTYVIPNQDRRQIWERPLDLPCTRVRVRVESGQEGEVAANIARVADEASGERRFAAERLPAGRLLRLELRRLPVPLVSYARYAAVAGLGTLVLAICGWPALRRFAHRGRGQRAASSTTTPSPAPRR